MSGGQGSAPGGGIRAGAAAAGVPAPGVPVSFDHLVLAVPELAAGVEEFERRTGAVSVPGGRHPGRGTANHLVPLVPRGWSADALTYLEILGPDPEQDPALASASLHGFDRLAAQRWAVHPEDFDATIAAAAEAGADFGAVFDMARDTPEGGRLAWRLTRRSPLAFGGAQPFLIDWQDSLHPAQALRADTGLPVLTLERLEFFGPEPEALVRALGVLAASGAECGGTEREHGAQGAFVVEEAAHAGFRAVLSGPLGEVVMETPATVG
ncbi:VOC family protein [Brevibacterium album]|uniref:VOC family protein n=1 Tax=Brevibacterium album TaxID=417948 RepID=UPI00041279A9|nr:VOC family protein [Brevibacterium album]